MNQNRPKDPFAGPNRPAHAPSSRPRPRQRAAANQNGRDRERSAAYPNGRAPLGHGRRPQSAMGNPQQDRRPGQIPPPPGRRRRPTPAPGPRPQFRDKGAKTQAVKPAKQKKSSGGVPRWVLILLNFLIVIPVIVAIYFFWKPYNDEKNADEFKEELLAKMEQEKTPFQVKVPKYFGMVQGERNEDFGVDFVDNAEDQITTDKVTLNYVGKLVIPKIAVETPLSYDDHPELLISLRFGSGIHAGSAFANINEPGLTTIWGHRFLTNGKDFNRLDEIVEGDQFYIDHLPTGKRYYYTVTEQLIIERDQLPDYMFAEYDEDVVCLVTCHPPVYGADNQRLMVFAKPDPERTIDLP